MRDERFLSRISFAGTSSFVLSGMVLVRQESKLFMHPHHSWFRLHPHSRERHWALENNVVSFLWSGACATETNKSCAEDASDQEDGTPTHEILALNNFDDATESEGKDDTDRTTVKRSQSSFQDISCPTERSKKSPVSAAVELSNCPPLETASSFGHVSRETELFSSSALSDFLPEEEETEECCAHIKVTAETSEESRVEEETEPTTRTDTQEDEEESNNSDTDMSLYLSALSCNNNDESDDKMLLSLSATTNGQSRIEELCPITFENDSAQRRVELEDEVKALICECEMMAEDFLQSGDVDRIAQSEVVDSAKESASILLESIAGAENEKAAELLQEQVNLLHRVIQQSQDFPKSGSNLWDMFLKFIKKTCALESMSDDYVRDLTTTTALFCVVVAVVFCVFQF